MAVQTGTKRPHQANKTPPPNSRIGHVNQGDYGANGVAGRSSVDPGQTVTSPLADNLRQNQDDGQDALGKVISKGVAKNDSLAAFGDVQQRDVSPKQFPTTYSMRNRNADANPKIPGALVPNDSEPSRKPR